MNSHFICNSFDKLTEGFHAGLFDLLHTGISLLSPDGNYLYCNKAFLNIFKFTPDAIGTNVNNLFVTGESGVMEVIRSKQPIISYSQAINNKNGISFRFPIIDEHDKICGVICESVSLTASKEKLKSIIENICYLENIPQKSPQVRTAHDQQKKLYSFSEIIGESNELLNIKKLGLLFASNNEPVLISGESGSGKELVAQAIHMASSRCNKPFVTVNCAALPPELFESELFGYDTGAFTGARQGGLMGKFEMANGGTLFFDEIGELPLAMQAKLLRVLESGEIQKIAHRGNLYSDFRLIGASNRDLRKMVQDGQFREDLFYRLNIFELYVPPLRKRLEDIPLLVRYFITKYAGSSQAKNINVSPEVFNLFFKYAWPGNIRELKNILTYSLCSMENNNSITIDNLPNSFIKNFNNYKNNDELTLLINNDISNNENNKIKELNDTKKLKDLSSNLEKSAILETLKNCKYNKSLAAKILGISRNNLYKKLHQYNLLNEV